MKRSAVFFVTLLCAAQLVGLSAQSTSEPPASKKTASVKKPVIEVCYFHFTRRCLTCNAVERETLEALQALYPKQLKSGRITFKSLNLDEQNGQNCAGKCGAEGQSLLVLAGGKKWDLTSQGFMYARSNPDKLKAELKKVIDPLLK